MTSTLVLNGRWLQDTAWVALANLSQAAGPFLALLFLGRWHGLEAAGQFAFALAVTGPLAQLLNFQLKALILTHASEELPLSVTASVRAIVSLPALLLVLCLLIAATPLAGLWMAARLVDSWAELFQAEFQRSGDLVRAAFSQIFRTMGLVLAIGIAPSPATASLLFLAFSLILLVLYDWRLLPIRMTIHWPVLSPVLSRGFVLGFVLFLQTAGASIPRIVLENCAGSETLGLFATLSVLLQVGVLVSSSFGQSLLPELPGASLGRIASWSTIPLFGATIAFSVEQAVEPLLFDVLGLVLNPRAHEILFALGLAQLTVWPAAMIGFALTAKRLYNELLWVAFSTLVAGATGSLALIPIWGYYGAALTIAGTGATTLIVSFINLANAENRDERTQQ